MIACCANCKLRFRLKKNDYSNGGCEHSDMKGFVCMAFGDEGLAVWMYGVGEKEKCECFTPKEQKGGNE